MPTDVSAVIIAVSGVGGTLAATFLAQLGSARSKAAEARVREVERAAEWVREDRLRAAGERRSCYVEFIAAVRHLNLDLMDAVRELRADGTVSKAQRGRLDKALLDFRRRHAEASMVMPQDVFDTAVGTSGALNGAWAIYLRSRDAAEPEAAATDLAAATEHVRLRIRELRAAMRADLGIHRGR